MRRGMRSDCEGERYVWVMGTAYHGLGKVTQHWRHARRSLKGSTYGSIEMLWQAYIYTAVS
jgi:hypothetical protein